MFASLAGVLFDGFAFGMLLFLLSVGLSVTLGMMNFVNLAHCSFAMIGGYVTVSLANRYGWPFLATLPAAFLAAAAVAVVLERTLYRRLYRASDLDQCLLTIGIVFISVAAFAWFYTSEQQSAPVPEYLRGSVQILGQSFASYRIFLIAVSLAITALLVLLVERTRFGARLRAAVDNQRVPRRPRWRTRDPDRRPRPELRPLLSRLRADRRGGGRARLDRRLVHGRSGA